MKIIIFGLLLLFGNIGYAQEYNREKDYGSWIDQDGDGQNTREEVLERDSLVGVEKNKDGKIIWGIWFCPYSGLFFDNPKSLDIDHFVPLVECDKSGGSKWEREKKIRYTNYLPDRNHLMVTYNKYNRSKGGKDISSWLPLIYVQEYVYNWWKIKDDWGLCFDLEEIKVLEKYGLEEDNLCNY